MLRACLFLSVALAAVAPRLADACSPPLCEGGSVTPIDTGAVPANLPGLVWQPLLDRSKLDDKGDPSKVTLTRSGDAKPIPFTAQPLDGGRMLLVPDAPLTVGETYQISDATTCSGGGASFSRSLFSVRPAVAMPTTLGTLRASEQLIEELSVPTYTGSCTSEVQAARREIWLAMDAVTDEWLELLEVQAYVDDRLYGPTRRVWGPPGTRQAGASVQVHRTCVSADSGADPGLTAGPHTIRMEARLPGTSVVVASDSITFDLSCEGLGGLDEPTSDGGGCNASSASSLGALSLALGALVLRRRRPRAA